MFVLLRTETQNYGWVLSVHRTIEQADAAYTKRVKKLPAGTAVSLMYEIRETTQKVKKGERVRFDSLNGS
jgi:hypothetical protein